MSCQAADEQREVDRAQALSRQQALQDQKKRENQEKRELAAAIKRSRQTQPTRRPTSQQPLQPQQIQQEQYEVDRALALSIKEAQERSSRQQASPPYVHQQPQQIQQEREQQELDRATALSIEEAQERSRKQQAQQKQSAKAPLPSGGTILGSLSGCQRIPHTDWSEWVKQQFGAMCGYHAIYNLKPIMDAIRANHPVQAKAPLQKGPPLKEWQVLIQARGGPLENISDKDVSYLAFQVQKLPPDFVTIIPNLNDWNPSLDCNFYQVAARLQKTPGYVHGFLVNTAGHISAITPQISAHAKREHKGFIGHWTAIVMNNQNGIIHLHVADSAYNPDTKSYGNIDTIKRIYEWVTTDIPILRALTEIPNKLETAQNVMEENFNYKRGQELINEVTATVRATPGLETNSYYRNNIVLQLETAQQRVNQLRRAFQV